MSGRSSLLQGAASARRTCTFWLAGGYERWGAALPWRGHALPGWAAVCRPAWQGRAIRCNRPEPALIAAIPKVLRAGRPQTGRVWIADWGFARLGLFGFLAGVGVDFGLWVNAGARMAWRGRNLLRSELPVRPGPRLWLEGEIYRPEGGGIRVSGPVVWKQGSRKSPEERGPGDGVTTGESLGRVWAEDRRRMRIGGLSGLGSSAWG